MSDVDQPTKPVRVSQVKFTQFIPSGFITDKVIRGSKRYQKSFLSIPIRSDWPEDW